jgi:hypothetical protein
VTPTIPTAALAGATTVKYHFHVRIKGDLELDSEGIELSCQCEARSVIVECLREFFCEPRADLPVNDCHFEVIDEFGALVMTVPFMAGLDS